MIKIRMYVHTGYVGANHEDFYEIEKSEWEDMTEKEREDFLDEIAREYMYERIEFGANVAEG